MLELKDETVRRLSGDFLRRLRRLETWDLSATRQRVRTKNHWSETRALAVELEYRKFIAMIVICPDRGYGMAGPVDKYWHAHLLDTFDYSQMCGAVAGKFIHHTPDADDTPPGLSSSAYENHTLPDLEDLFGGVNARFWPRFVGKCGKCSDIARGATA